MQDLQATLRRLDLDHVWHPYTQMKDLRASDFPIIVKAEGRKLIDAEGRTYMDGTSSMWLNVHGHQVPQIDDAVRGQLEKVAHSTLLGQGSEPSIRLAARLATATGIPRVFFSDNGSTAVEAALKMAVAHWAQRGRQAKRRFASFDGAYHGDTLGAIAVAPVPEFHRHFLHLLPEAPLRLPWPETARGPWRGEPERARDEALAEADRLLRIHRQELAAVIVEPVVQFVGGLRIMPPGYLRGLRQICTDNEVLLITDEVATGFGRTGTLFAQDHDQVEADLMAVGKGLTGGYLPLAATLASEEIYESFLGSYEDMKAFYHGHSFTGNALGCAAALANLDLLDEVLPTLGAKADALHAAVAAAQDHPYVAEVRQIGLAVGFDLVTDKARDGRTPFSWQTRAAWSVYEEARVRDLLARPYASTGFLVPPLGSTVEELTWMGKTYVTALHAATPVLAHKAQQAWPPIREVP